MTPPRMKSFRASVWGVVCASGVFVAFLWIGHHAHAALITRDVNVTLDASIIESYDLDVDLDGIIDFTFTAALALDPIVSAGFDVVDFPFGGNNGVVIDAPTFDGFPTASILAAGDAVSPADSYALASFDQGNLFFFTTFDPPSGHFEGQTGFLGLRFDRLGGTVFGFAQVTVNALTASINPLGLTIGTVGFNDVPGEPVTIGAANAVPEPSSLIMMGTGLLGILGVIRKRGSRLAKAAATT